MAPNGVQPAPLLLYLDLAAAPWLRPHVRRSARNLSCLNFGGRHVSIAMLRGAEATINIFTIMRNRLRLSGSTMKSRPFPEKARLARDIRAKVWPHLEAGRFRPVLDQAYPLAEAAKAHERMESSGHIGKIVLKIR